MRRRRIGARNVELPPEARVRPPQERRVFIPGLRGRVLSIAEERPALSATSRSSLILSHPAQTERFTGGVV